MTESRRVSFLEFREHMVEYRCHSCKHYNLIKSAKLRIPIVCVDCFGMYVEETTKNWRKE